MTDKDIARLRLSQQQISGGQFKSVKNLVSWLGAVQAQDYPGAKWSIGLRLADATDDFIEQAIAGRTIVRNWLMRGTLHFTAAEDIHWMLNLLSPRLLVQSKRRHEQLGLDKTTLHKCGAIFEKSLAGGKEIMRKELLQILEQNGISTEGQRGYHILWWAAQNGIICFGTMQGKQQTFTLLDEWVETSKILEVDEAAAELARRYFSSRGPATLQDFIWWSGLTSMQARNGVENIKFSLIKESVDDKTYWMAENICEQQPIPGSIHLLPGFDEFLLAYRDRSASMPGSHKKLASPGNGMFHPTIIMDGRVTGTWKRTFKKNSVHLNIKPFNHFRSSEKKIIEDEAKHFGHFVDRDVLLTFDEN